jgi:hypothetical protein
MQNGIATKGDADEDRHRADHPDCDGCRHRRPFQDQAPKWASTPNYIADRLILVVSHQD